MRDGGSRTVDGAAGLARAATSGEEETIAKTSVADGLWFSPAPVLSGNSFIRTVDGAGMLEGRSGGWDSLVASRCIDVGFIDAGGRIDAGRGGAGRDGRTSSADDGPSTDRASERDGRGGELCARTFDGGATAELRASTREPIVVPSGRDVGAPGSDNAITKLC